MSHVNNLYEEIAEIRQNVETSFGTIFTAATETASRVGAELTVSRVVGQSVSSHSVIHHTYRSSSFYHDPGIH